MIRLHYKKFIYLVFLVIACVFGSYKFILANDLEIDQQAPFDKQPKIEIEEQSGVPIINITEPSPAGISHNIFKEYNVGEEGVIFNNNPDKSPEWNPDNMSVLAKSPLFINENLHGQAARIILTEVSGYNISNLLGATEIYGKGADFILANPNGIYCNGAGFINAHRVTLTTGKPEIDIKGVLHALNVDRGTIEIHTKGLSIQLAPGAASPVEILSRAVKISGTLAVQDAVYLYTGKNRFDCTTRELQVQEDRETSTKPYLAIDAALVGKIGARKITIIATEQGVGVNCPPLIADADNIEITADGNVQLKDVQTAGDLLVKSQLGNIVQEAQKSIVQKRCKLKAKQGAIYLSTEQFQANHSTKISSKHLHLGSKTQLWVGTDTNQDVVLKLPVQGEIHNQGAVYAPKIILNKVGHQPIVKFHNSGKLISYHDLVVEGQTVYNQGEICVNRGSCTLIGHFSIRNEKEISSHGIRLHTKEVLENAGQLFSREGLIVDARAIQQAGTIKVTKGVKIGASEELVNTGIISSNYSIDMASGSCSNLGKIIAKRELTATTGYLDNKGVLTSEQGKIKIESIGDIKNLGTIQTQDGIHLTAKKELTNQGVLKATKAVELIGAKILNEGSLASIKGRVTLNAENGIYNKKLIVGAKKVKFKSKGTIQNQHEVISHNKLILSATNLANKGKLYGESQAMLYITDGIQNDNIINTKGKLLIRASHIRNEGIISGCKRLVIQADNLENTQEINSIIGGVNIDIQQTLTNQKNAKIVSQKNLIVQSATFTNQGNLITNALLKTTINQKAINQGLVKAQNNLVFKANELENSGEINSQKGNIKLIIAKSLANSGRIQIRNELKNHLSELINRDVLTSKLGCLKLVASEQFTNSGSIESAQKLAFRSNTFINEPSGKLISNELLRFKNIKQFINRGEIQADSMSYAGNPILSNNGVISVVQSMDLVTQSLHNKGVLRVKSGSLTLHSEDKVENDDQAVLSSAQEFKIITQGQFINHGRTEAIDGPFTTVAKSIQNKGKLFGPSIHLTATEGILDNTNIIYATGNVELKACNSITQAGTLASGNRLDITTDNNLGNTGTIHSTSELHIQAKNITNEGSIEAKSANIGLTATQKIINNNRLISRQADINLKAQEIENQQEGTISSGTQLMLHAAQITNQKEAILSTQNHLKLVEITQFTNAGCIQAYKLSHGGIPIIQNLGKMELHDNLSLITQSFVNTGEIILTAGDIVITSQANLTVEKGKIASQQGNTRLAALTGNLINISGVLSSYKDMLLTAQGYIENKQLINANNNLTIQGMSLINSGEIVTKEGNIRIKELRSKLHNTNKIQAGGRLEIASVESINEGQLISSNKLKLETVTLDNQNKGHIQAQIAEIKVADHLLNNGKINAERELGIQAGKVTNLGNIQTNNTLTLSAKTGNLDNAGTISSERGSGTITVHGTLKNNKDIKSYLNLTVLAAQSVKNKGQFIVDQKLNLEACSIDNRGKLVGRAGAEIITKKDLINTGLLGTGKDLSLEVGGQLKNTEHGQVLQLRGQLKINAYSLYNSSDLNFFPVGQHNNIQINDFIYNSGKIRTRGGLNFAATNHIENRGSIVAEQTLKVEAPIINHFSGDIQSNQGDVSLIATRLLYNAGNLNACKGTFVITTDHLDNQADIKLDKNLILNIQNLDNSGTISARGSLELLKLEKLINYSSGVLAGGEGENRLIITSTLENYGHIFTNGSLSIQAVNVGIINKGKLSANGNLDLSAKNLTNDQLVQGGGTTKLSIDEYITNNGSLSSINDLAIKAKGIKSETEDPTPTIQANHSISIEVDRLSGNDIKGGNGDTRIVVQNDFNQNNLISSANNLYIKTKEILNNHGRIIAAENLTVKAQSIENNSNGCIQGGKGFTNLQSKHSTLCNKGLLSSLHDMKLNFHWVNNRGSIQSGNSLSMSIGWFRNDPGAAIFAGEDINIHATKGTIANDEGNIFANGNIVLEVRDVGGSPSHITNSTSHDHEGRIEAIGNITIRANELYNKSQISSGNNYITHRKYVGNPGIEKYVTTHEMEVTSTMTTRPAYIQAQGNLEIELLEEGVNYGGVIMAGKDINIKGKAIQDVRPSEEVYIPDYYCLGKKTIEKQVSGEKVVAGIFTLGVSTIFSGVSEEVEHSSTSYKGKTVTIYSTNEAICCSGANMRIEAKSFQNGIPISSVNVAPCMNPFEKVAQTQTISTFSLIELPKGNYEMFRLQKDPYASDTGNQSIVPLQVQVGEIKQPDNMFSPISSGETNLDALLAETLAPAEADFDDFRHLAALSRAHTSFDPRPVTERTSGYMPVVASDFPNSVYTPIPCATDPGMPSYELPLDLDLSDHTLDNLSAKTNYYKPAPKQEPIKFTFLPPLVRTNGVVDQSKFYGSPYFLRHVGLDPDRFGMPNVPFRFLGDPFFESRLINDAIRKQTSRVFLYDDVATPEEQLKRLIDNTATVTKDLKLTFGVSLSKDQINTLKKDILWYVEEEVAGQKVLVPEIYLTQTTINNLRSGKETGIYSRGDMNLQIAGPITNTGNINSGGNQTIRAESLHNESFGKTQAAITANGIVDLETKDNVKNISGKIAGQQGARVVSREGSIHNVTKLLDNSTLHTQASIESGANLLIQAKGDILNKAGDIKATGNGIIKSERGDIKNETQNLVHKYKIHNNSNDGGFWSKRSSHHTTAKTTIKQAVSSIAVGGDLTMDGRDISFLGTQVDIYKKAHMKASRNFEALAVQDIQETSKHTKTNTQERGLLTFSSSSNSKNTYHKKVTSKGPNFNIGKEFKLEVGENAGFEGADVVAKNIDMNVEGETTIRKAYNEDIHENSSSTEIRNEALFGLLKDNEGNTTEHKKYDKIGIGNNWEVHNNFNLKSKGNITTQGIDLTARNIDIESTQGNIYDRAAKEVHKDYTDSTKYTLKQGIVGGKLQGEQGRSAIKLREKIEEKKNTRDNEQIAQSSSFRTTAIVKKNKDRTTTTTAGNATFKAARKLELGGTDANIQGKLSLQGKEGVEIFAKKETIEHEGRNEKYTEELSIGIKNSIIAAGHQAIGVKGAYDQLTKVKQAYHSYRRQLRQAQRLLDQRTITKEEYELVAAEEKYHLAAIGTATLDLASKSKQFLSSASQAILNAGTTLGISVDLQADINKVAEDFISYVEKAKGSDIKAEQIEIITEQTCKISGSQIQSEGTTIEAQNLVVESFKGHNNTKSTGYNTSGNSILDIGSKPGLDINLRGQINNGNTEGVQHINSMLNLGNTTLNIKKDITIQGAQVKTSSLDGEVGGKLHVESLQDTNQSSQHTIGGSMGVGVKPGLGSMNLGINGSKSRRKEKWAEEISSFTASGSFKLKVKGKSKLIGAQITSESGQMQLETEKVEFQDLQGYKKGSSIEGGVNLNFSKVPSIAKPKIGASANANYSRNNSRQKIKAGLGGGTVKEIGSRQTKVAQRVTEEGPISYLNTESQIKIDNNMARLVTNPVRSAKEVVKDSKVVYTVGEGIVEAALAAPKYGLEGTIQQIQNTFVDIQTITTLAENKEVVKKINGATNYSSEELRNTLDNQFDYQQSQAGIAEKDRASVHLYQGDDVAFDNNSKAGNLRNYKGGYNKGRNEVYVNTQRTDISNGSDIQRLMFTELQRKENHKNPFLKDLTEKQQKAVAYDRGDRAAKVWRRFSRPASKPNPIAVSNWNDKNKHSLAKSTQRISRIEDRQVKPRVLEKLDPRYHIAKNKGDEARAQAIKERWEQVEKDIVETIKDTKPAYFIPVVGSGIAAVEDIGKEDYLNCAINSGFCLLEGYSIGIGALGTKGAYIGSKVLEKQLLRQSKNLLVKEGVQLFEKKTVKGVESAINKGQKELIRTVKGTPKLIGTARNNLLNTVQDTKLKNLINDLYRPGAKYGSGSSMDAFILEKNLGVRVGGKSHHAKLLNYRAALQRLWGNRANLLPSDRRITKQILQDIQSALSNY